MFISVDEDCVLVMLNLFYPKTRNELQNLRIKDELEKKETMINLVDEPQLKFGIMHGDE